MKKTYNFTQYILEDFSLLLRLGVYKRFYFDLIYFYPYIKVFGCYSFVLVSIPYGESHTTYVYLLLHIYIMLYKSLKAREEAVPFACILYIIKVMLTFQEAREVLYLSI